MRLSNLLQVGGDGCDSMVFHFFSAPLADAWLARVSDAEDEGWLARVSEVEDDASGSCNWESWP